MYCKNCGNKLKEGSNFCSKCGKKIENNDDDKNIVDADIEEENSNDNLEADKKEVMYCRNCGLEIPSDTINCPNCGYNLKTVNDNDFFEKFIIIICSFIFPLIGIIIWAILRSSNPKNAKNALISSLISMGITFLLIILIIIFVFIALFF